MRLFGGNIYTTKTPQLTACGVARLLAFSFLP